MKHASHATGASSRVHEMRRCLKGVLLPIPPLTDIGDLPLGVHPASLAEVLDRFAVGSAQRIAVGLRLERIYAVARATGHMRRFVVFGSFITAKEEPNDVDVFFIMEDSFDPALLSREAQSLFDHTAAQAQFGASVFWFRRLALFGGRAGSSRILAGKTGRRFARHYRDHRGEAMITNDQELGSNPGTYPAFPGSSRPPAQSRNQSPRVPPIGRPASWPKSTECRWKCAIISRCTRVNLLPVRERSPNS